ncbi:MAG: hypothetical protein R3E56_03380 [Burkholderiaceae bacterium]
MHWEPLTREDLQQELDKAVGMLHPGHRKKFEEISVVPWQVEVTDRPGTFFWVVAEHEGQLLYYEDVEEGWEVEKRNETGGIDGRWANQFELKHVMFQLFGEAGGDST